MLLVETSLQEGPRIDARCGMPLKKDRVAGMLRGTRVKICLLYTSDAADERVRV